MEFELSHLVTGLAPEFVQPPPRRWTVTYLMAVLALELGAGEQAELFAAEDAGAGAITDGVSPHVVQPLHQFSAAQSAV